MQIGKRQYKKIQLENAFSAMVGGEGGIRTLDTLLTYTHFPGVRLQPLGHLSFAGKAYTTWWLPVNRLGSQQVKLTDRVRRQACLYR